MTALDAKELADQVNERDIDLADAELDHVNIEIGEAAKRGEYEYEYQFSPNKSFGLANAVKNSLKEAGFEVVLKGSGDHYKLNIDWSNDER